MAESEEALIGRLLVAVPELRSEYDAMYAEYRAEGLEHGAVQLFLDEHTRELTDRYPAPDAIARVVALAGFLETEFGRDLEIDSLIKSGFVVLLPVPSDSEPDVAQHLGPKLRAELDNWRNWRAPRSHILFVDRMTAAVPALESLADDNRFWAHDDVLVHGFLDDLVRRVVESYLSGEERRLGEVRAVFGLLEAEYGRDSDIDEPIAVSFIENLPYPDDPGGDIVGLLGPRLTEELLRQWPSRLDRQ